MWVWGLCIASIREGDNSGARYCPRAPPFVRRLVTRSASCDWCWMVTQSFSILLLFARISSGLFGGCGGDMKVLAVMMPLVVRGMKGAKFLIAG